MESMLWTRLTDGRLRCGLCAHACVLSPGQRGRCGVRCNHEGHPLSLVDGLVTGVQADPVEKKPLYPSARPAGPFPWAVPDAIFPPLLPEPSYFP